MRFHFQAGQQREENQDWKRCDQRRDPPDPGGIINLRPTHTSPLVPACIGCQARVCGRSISRRSNFVKKWNPEMHEENCEEEPTETYARAFLLSNHTHAQPATSIRNCGASGVLSGGGGGG